MSIGAQQCYCRSHTLHLISAIADFSDKHPRKCGVHQPELSLEGLIANLAS